MSKKTKLMQPWEQDPVCKSGRARKDACVCPPVQPSSHVPLSTLSKLGSIAVHAEEMLSENGTHFDEVALKSLLCDAEVVAWIKTMGALLQVKR